ncbi:class I SAM-dependent methyltransferase [Herbaspirillum sp. GCM10030257]|uniref:class I SAM-dependent methyltransferase n=1 Tax=Herbaspirillum sp. GCM10030257 TaxID=3273393 RepID=UPI00361DD669
MSDWTAGYVADIGYTYGYYSELNPLHLRFAFLSAGLAEPNVRVACELGFGQGLSANIHAAASITKWYGTDFNPSQAAFAQELAQVSGSNAQLFDEGFAEFCARSDLPDFDYIGLHGIWSWISDENRKTIVDFLRRKLKVGGVLYISYNTQPGWAAMVPMRHLLTEHAEIMAAPGRGIVSRVDAAMDFAGKLLATNPLYARANPQVVERIAKMKEQNRNYLAHEYFNRDWHPMPFAEMAEWLAPAKLDFACSAHYLSHVDVVNLTEEQQTFLKEIPDVMFRESVRDFMVNQQFRKDYWVKGARTLSALDRIEHIRQQRVILVVSRADVSLKTKGALGEAKMSEAVYSPILDTLAGHSILTVGQIEQEVASRGISLGQVVEALMLLTHMGVLTAVQDAESINKAKPHVDKLNLYLMSKARSSNEISYLASAVNGGGIALGRFQQLFILAIRLGKTEPAELASFVWNILSAQGQKIVKEGKTLETVEDNLAELTAQATTFTKQQLPILKALQVA